MKIGVLGGGQLALMMARPAKKLGVTLVAFDPSPDACAKKHIDVTCGDYSNLDLIKQFISSCDVVTFETENIPLEAAIIANEKLFPPLDALRISQDRLLEKLFLRSQDVNTADFIAISSYEDLVNAAVQFPCVLKTCREGYDGKGQFVLREQADVKNAWEKLGGRPLILESFVPFDCEVSLISVRAKNGDIQFYPLVHNHHEEGILRLSRAPFVNKILQSQAEHHAKKILETWEYAGVLTIEFFVMGEELIANEMAPRVHNSGHWTIEGAVTSQFENHIRAIAGLPLGETTPIGVSAMCNVIGELPVCMDVPHAVYHDYGKAPRAKRKLGHVTVNHGETEVVDATLDVILRM